MIWWCAICVGSAIFKCFCLIGYRIVGNFCLWECTDHSRTVVSTANVFAEISLSTSSSERQRTTVPNYDTLVFEICPHSAITQSSICDVAGLRCDRRCTICAILAKILSSAETNKVEKKRLSVNSTEREQALLSVKCSSSSAPVTACNSRRDRLTGRAK